MAYNQKRNEVKQDKIDYIVATHHIARIIGKWYNISTREYDDISKYEKFDIHYLLKCESIGMTEENIEEQSWSLYDFEIGFLLMLRIVTK